MAHIDEINDLFTRMLVWYNIRSMVNLSLVPLLDYVELIQKKLFVEPYNFLLDKLLQNLNFCLQNFIDVNSGQVYQSMVLQSIYEALVNVVDTQKERIQILQNYYIDYARSEKEISSLWKWLKGTDPNLAKRVLNIDQKWSIVKKVFTLPISADEKWQLFQLVKAQDEDVSRVEEQ